MSNPNPEWLRKAAEQIRDAGHAGWGNTCEQAAENIEKLEAQLAELRDVSAKVIAATRGSGGINPNAVEALRELQIVLERDYQRAFSSRESI